MLRDMTDARRTDQHIQSQKPVSTFLLCPMCNLPPRLTGHTSRHCILPSYLATFGHHYKQASLRCLANSESAQGLFIPLIACLIQLSLQDTRNICQRIFEIQARQEIDVDVTSRYNQVGSGTRRWQSCCCRRPSVGSCFHRAFLRERSDLCMSVPVLALIAHL